LIRPETVHRKRIEIQAPLSGLVAQSFLRSSESLISRAHKNAVAGDQQRDEEIKAMNKFIESLSSGSRSS
jgi:hypothetical protein